MALAKWYKVDFHTHSPKSSCFVDKSVTPQQWLKAAKDSGMNEVVLTDHNSVTFVNELETIKSKYEEENQFKVFYGVVVSTVTSAPLLPVVAVCATIGFVGKWLNSK